MKNPLLTCTKRHSDSCCRFELDDYGDDTLFVQSLIPLCVSDSDYNNMHLSSDITLP